MILEQLSITKNRSYDAQPDGFKGRVKFTNAQGTVELELNHEVSTKILAVVADAVVESAKDIAHNLSANVFTQLALPKNDRSSLIEG